MNHPFLSSDGRNILGQGGWILLTTLPAVLAAVGVHLLAPSLASLPAALEFLRPLGWVLLLPGVALWLSGVVQLLRLFPRGQLITTGAYGFCRNPVYSSFILFFLPGLSLLTLTWIYLVVDLVLVLSLWAHLGKEEAQLTQVFGQAYRDYQASVGRILPRWQGWSAVRAWVVGHPVGSFLGLTLGWSWGLWSFLFLFFPPGGLVNNPPPLSFLFVIGGGFGPTLAGLVLTAVIDGRAGFRALGARLSPRRLGSWWWAVLIIPAFSAVTPLLRWATGGPVDFAAMPALVIPGIVLGLTAGLMEEFGWRGFLLPRLLNRFSPLVATLLLALVWGGLWHGYADYFALGDRGLGFFPLVLLVGPCLLGAWSMVIHRVFLRTQGNLLLSWLMHASISSTAWIFGLKYANPTEEFFWTAVSVAVAALGGCLVWFGLAASRTSMKGRFFNFLMRNRHLFRGKLRREVFDLNTSIPAFRDLCERGAARNTQLPPGITVRSERLGSIPVEWITPSGAAPGKLILYVHGGGYVSGSCDDHRWLVAQVAARSQITCLQYEYRLAPEHPFPAALDDSLSVYEALLKREFQPANIVVMGESAGGGLTLSLLIAIRDCGLPIPAAGVAISPWTDLTCSGASYTRANKRSVAPPNSWNVFSHHYVGENDPRNPLVSPLYGDLAGLPPLLVNSGMDDELFDDGLRFATKAMEARVPVQFRAGVRMVHCYPLLAPHFPEAEEAFEEIIQFVKGHLEDPLGPAPMDRGKASYEILVQGPMGSFWADWFGDQETQVVGKDTLLILRSADQSTFYGLVRSLGDLDRTILAIRRNPS